MKEILFHYPIVEIEKYIENFSSNTKNRVLFSNKSNDVFENNDDRVMTMFIFENQILDYIIFVDLLMKI